MADSLDILQAIQGAVRAQADKSLRNLLKRWRYTQSGDHGVQELKPDSERFLVRYGALDAGDSREKKIRAYRNMLSEFSRASGEAPGIVAAWMELFAAGEYGVLEGGICAPEPHCTRCPLQARCRYLAAGGKDTRSSGSGAAQELLLPGPGRVTDLRTSDVLAYILSDGSSGAADIARAEAILKEFGGLRGTFQADADALAKLGLPEIAVARLRALSEIVRLWTKESALRGRQFNSAQDFYDHYHLRMRDLKKEVFIVAILDQKHNLVAEDQVSEGTLTETLVHPREVFAKAIALRAAAVAVLHNHPTGDPAPSPPDKAITKRLGEAGKHLGIRLLDHIIIGDGRFFSFVDNGLFV